MPKSKHNRKRKHRMAGAGPSGTAGNAQRKRAPEMLFEMPPRPPEFQCQNPGFLFARDPIEVDIDTDEALETWPMYRLLPDQEYADFPARIYVRWGEWQFAAFPPMGWLLRDICDCQNCAGFVAGCD